MTGAGLPPSPPTEPPRKHPDEVERYNRVAETVGLMPTLRVKDNVVQAIVVLGATGLGAAVGWLQGGGFGAVVGGAAAMILSAFVSGFVLMVLGWTRGAKGRR